MLDIYKQIYAINIVYSQDSLYDENYSIMDTCTYLFNDYKEAESFMQDNYYQEIRIEQEENGFNCDIEMSYEYGYIIIHGIDCNYKTEYYLTSQVYIG